MKHTENIDNLRIPRPKGFTNVCRTGENKVIYDTAVKHYLQGAWPQAVALSHVEFSRLLNIPMNSVTSRIKDGLASELLQGKDLKATLEEERLKLLSSTLFGLGNSDAESQRLAAYLTSRIYNNPKSWPDLIKELNTVIGTQVRLSETKMKMIDMLTKVLETAPQEVEELAPEDKPLDRDEILTYLDKSFNPSELAGGHQKYLEGTPDIAPHNLGPGSDANKVAKTLEVHEYQDPEEVDPVAIHQSIIISPK
jgi:hypothetical protein